MKSEFRTTKIKRINSILIGTTLMQATTLMPQDKDVPSFLSTQRWTKKTSKDVPLEHDRNNDIQFVVAQNET